MDFVNRFGLACLLMGGFHFSSPHVYVWLPSLVLQMVGLWFLLN